MSADIKAHLANDLEQSAAMLDSREFDAVQLDNCASMMRYAATVIRQALAEQPAQQCVCGEPETSGTHRTAGPCYAEQPAPAPAPDPDELTIAYLNGIDTGKKRKPWVGLTDEDKEFIAKRAAVYDWHDYEVIEASEAKLKEKNA